MPSGVAISKNSVGAFLITSAKILKLAAPRGMSICEARLFGLPVSRITSYNVCYTKLLRPVGVVGVVCPWNLPLLLMTWKVGPALACGNTVVVKPSEETPSTATLLGEVMNACGVPKGVYNVA